MNLGLVMRSPKFRILLYVIIFGGACLTVMLLHNTHSHLKEAENSFAMCQQEKEKCDQGKDSVSAQLQVLYEQKKRLEMTLQQERSDHQKAKEGMEKKSIEIQAVHSQLQKEMSELQSKYTQLSSDYKSLKEANDQSQTELADMKENYSSLEKEKQNLNLELSTQLQTLHQQEAEVNQLNDQLKMMSIEKQRLDYENAQRIKKHDNNLISCQKQHQQLMLQFDEVSHNLNNCITGRNNSRQEILHMSQKQMAQYAKNNVPHDTGEKTEHEMEQNDKSVHNQVGNKVRTKYSQNDYAINKSQNNENLIIHPHNQLHIDQSRQENNLLPYHVYGAYDTNENKLHDKPLYNMHGNYIVQSHPRGSHGNSINEFQNKYNEKNQESDLAAYPLMPQPVANSYDLQKTKISFSNQPKNNAVIHGHVVE